MGRRRGVVGFRQRVHFLWRHPRDRRRRAETTGPLHAEVAGAAPLQVPDGDVSLDFCQANAFLKQGTADIPCNTLSVLLGHILTQEGSGVPGLTVSILNHPEFGSTTSQADGLYALAVPAGRWTVDARARSFVPSPRWVVAAARDFSHVDDIVVLRRDEKATTISLATGGLHVATTQTDSDGARTTSVFLPAGRKASLQLPDGGTVDAATLTLRATETTVGHVLAQSQRTVQRGRSQLTRRLGRRTTRRSRRA